jgi:hypothetical protein
MLQSFASRSGLVRRIPARVPPGGIGFLKVSLYSGHRYAHILSQRKAQGVTR